MPENIVAQLAKRYRKAYPHLKFKLVTAKLRGAFATTHIKVEEGLFVITFEKGLEQPLKAFLLAHEIAHAISWHGDVEEHGDSFWAAYRQTYKIYSEFTS